MSDWMDFNETLRNHSLDLHLQQPHQKDGNHSLFTSASAKIGLTQSIVQILG